MKPPRCVICDKRFSPGEGGDTVYFTPTKGQKEYLEKMRRENRVGHPPNCEWFCKKHLKKAISLKDFSINEALSKM